MSTIYIEYVRHMCNLNNEIFEGEDNDEKIHSIKPKCNS